MYIGVSRLARAAGGGSASNDRKLVESVNKVLQHSSMVNQQLINKVVKDLNKVIKSGNEEATVLLKRQLDALVATNELNKTGDAELARLLQKGQKLTASQYQSLDRYLEKMDKMAGALNSVLSSSLSEVSDNITKLVNGDTSNAARLQSAKHLAQVIGNSGLFDNSPAFKQLLDFVKTQTTLTEQSSKQLTELVDGMNSEVQAVDKLNDLIEITRDQSKDEKTQLIALDNIINTLDTGNKHLTDLSHLKDIANASIQTSEKMDKLSPILKKLSDNTMQTRTLHTLQQLEVSVKKSGGGRGLNPAALSKIKAGLASAGSKAGNKLNDHKSDITKALLGYIPFIGKPLQEIDMATDGSISNTIGNMAAGGAGYLGLKTLDKVKGAFKGRVARAAESGTLGSIERVALRAGGEEGLVKLLSKGGKWGKMAAAAAAATGYYLLSGNDADAAPMQPNVQDSIIPPGVAAAPPESDANPWAELGIYAAAPKVAEKTGVAALASKGAGKFAGKIAGKGAEEALTKSASKSLIGKAGGVIGDVAVGAYDYIKADSTKQRKEAVGSTVGSIGGTLAGAAAGAAIGSVIPIAGTAVGALIGAGIGFLGNLGGTAVADALSNPQDEIPDEITKAGPIAEAAYIDDMIKSGQYSSDDVKTLQKYQQGCLSNQNIADYIQNKTGGNLSRLSEIMNNSALPAAYPDIYSAIMNYVSNVLIPKQKQLDASNIQSIGTTVDLIDQKQDVGQPVSSIGGDNQPSNSIDNLQVKTQKSITAIDSLPPQDQKQVSDIIDQNIGNEKAEAYVDDSGQHSLVNKLMGWVSNVLPTGIFPMVTVGIDAGNDDDNLLEKIFNSGGGFFGGTKDQPPGSYNGPRTHASGSEVSQVTSAVENSSSIGALSAHFESGGKGVGVVSTGVGDAGGVSYGAHQIATKTGTMSAFMSSPEAASFSGQFAGLTPGTPAFTAAYKQYTSSAQGAAAMDDAQNKFLQRTHYDPLVAKIKKDTGVDITKQSRAVQESVYATAMQYGPHSERVSKALAGAGISGDGQQDQAKMIDAIYQSKLDNVSGDYSGSSPQVQASVANRIQREWDADKAILAADNGTAPQATAVDTTASAGTVASTGSSVAGVDLLTTPQTPEGTSGITVPPSPLNAQSGALVRQNETLKLSQQNAPAPAVVQAPAPSSGGGQAIMPPASIDDYGLAFANKLLWDK
ncbi:hypothetical protein DUQ00_10230 [Salmonella bongori]|nr:hypothetical protein [Salmonella bongori]ECC9596697.1 hypothetical protein [Salmonella bongori]EDP8661032.1 hypothetical protein [Salmonella bongori]